MQQMDIKNILQYPHLNCKVLLVMPQILKQYNTYIRTHYKFEPLAIPTPS
jgi:hypothetical protein